MRRLIGAPNTGCSARFSYARRIAIVREMTTSLAPLTIAAAMLALPVVVAGQDTPAVVTAVYQCRTLSDDAARLACFDKAAAELEQAQNARALVFGDEDAFPRFEGAELKGKIVEVRPNRAGQYVLTMPDGTRWLQTEWTKFMFDPKAGDAILIRKGLTGSYRASTRGTSFQVRQIG